MIQRRCATSFRMIVTQESVHHEAVCMNPSAFSVPHFLFPTHLVTSTPDLTSTSVHNCSSLPTHGCTPCLFTGPGLDPTGVDLEMMDMATATQPDITPSMAAEPPVPVDRSVHDSQSRMPAVDTGIGSSYQTSQDALFTRPIRFNDSHITFECI